MNHRIHISNNILNLQQQQLHPMLPEDELGSPNCPRSWICCQELVETLNCQKSFKSRCRHILFLRTQVNQLQNPLSLSGHTSKVSNLWPCIHWRIKFPKVIQQITLCVFPCTDKSLRPFTTKLTALILGIPGKSAFWIHVSTVPKQLKDWIRSKIEEQF